MFTTELLQYKQIVILEKICKNKIQRVNALHRRAPN